MNFYRYLNLHFFNIASIFFTISLFILNIITTPAHAKAIRFDNALLAQGQVVRQLGGVLEVIQDGRGFIWMGAENGLARYDGKEVQLFQEGPEGLPSNYIWDLSLDNNGDLWIATSKGLCRYDFERATFERISDLIPKGAITAMAWDSEGRLYYSNHNAIGRVDFASHSNTILPVDWPVASALNTNTIFDLKIDKTGAVWIASSKSGLAKFEPANNAVRYYFKNGMENSLSSNHVQVVNIDQAGQVWIGTFGEGINILNPTTGSIKQLTFSTEKFKESRTAVIMDIYQDSIGDIWVAVDHHGLFRFSQEFQLLDQYFHSNGNSNSIFSNQTRSIFEDRNHDIWVGLFPFSASIVNHARNNIETFQSDAEAPNSLSNNAILVFLQDSDGLIWVGTEGGLNVLDPKTGLFTRYMADPENPKALAANAILSVEEGNNGDIWVGTWSGGLHKFDKKTQTFKRYQSSTTDPHALGDAFVWSILRDREGTIWICNEKSGLHQYRPETDDFIRYQHVEGDPQSLSGNYVVKVIEDKNNALWIASYSGLNRFDKQTRKFTVFSAIANDPSTLSSNLVKALYEDSSGIIWVGTHDAGLNRLDPKTGIIKRISRDHGLPSSTISAIIEDNLGNIWLATNDGLARMDPVTFEISTYNIKHGLIGSNFNRDAALLDNTGKLFFGSSEGITAFRPEHMALTASMHPTYITHFRIANREVVAGAENSPLTKSILTTDTLNLPYDFRMFSFDFVTLNFRDSQLNQYAYQLKGFDPNWIELGERNTATYTNLNPGDYEFHIKAKAPGEDWQLSQHKIKIHIDSPAWLTGWAYCLYVVLASTLLYGVFAIGKLKKNSDVYRERSLTDPLTLAYNRAGILQIAQGIFLNNEIKSGVAVFLIDIDFFKKINDTRGHDAGDRVIIDVTNIIKRIVRRGDHLGRWGGEEFILLCSSVTPPTANDIAEKIRAEIANYLFEVEESPLQVTVSIGIAMVPPDESFEGACKRADKALYEAKTSGRNKVIASE